MNGEVEKFVMRMAVLVGEVLHDELRSLLSSTPIDERWGQELRDAYEDEKPGSFSIVAFELSNPDCSTHNLGKLFLEAAVERLTECFTGDNTDDQLRKLLDQISSEYGAELEDEDSDESDNRE